MIILDSSEKTKRVRDTSLKLVVLYFALHEGVQSIQLLGSAF